MIAIPSYLEQEAWQAFVEMRRAKGKSRPFTPYAAKQIIYELQRIKDAGHDPNAALKQSILHGWSDVFPAKDKPIQAASNSDYEKTQQWLREHSGPRPQKLRSVG